MQPGTHQLVWNAKGENGNVLPSGIYFVKVTTVTSLQTHKIVLIK
jgi:flagellar hook assembly protein FlgD